MKKNIQIIIGLFLVASLLIGCQPQENTGTTTGEVTTTAEEVTTPEPDTTTTVPAEALETTGIYYGAESEVADILVFDANLVDKKVILQDEPRVFFTEKPMNTLVKIWYTIEGDQLTVAKAEKVSNATLKAKYIGFSDSNFAEFEIGSKSFVVQVPSEQTDSLLAINPKELLEITIKQNAAEQANPDLVSFSK